MAQSSETFTYTAENAESHERELHAKLGAEALISATNFRERISNALPRVVSKIDEYFETGAPDHLVESFRRTRQDNPDITTWSEWLRADASVVPDEDIERAMGWHNDVLQKQAESQQILELFDFAKRYFFTQADKFYAQGFLAKMPENVQETSLVIGDVFDMAARNASGYHYYGSRQVAVHQGVGKTESEIISSFLDRFGDTLTHELVHSSIDTTPQHPDDPVSARWFGEAMTESISIKLREYGGEKFNDDDLGAYFPERQLVNTILNRGASREERSFAARLAARAFSGGVKERTAFIAQLDTAWETPDFLEKITVAVDEEARCFINEGDERSIAEAKAAHSVNARLREEPYVLLKEAARQMILRKLPSATKK